MAFDSIKRIFSGLLEKEQFHCSKCNSINSKESGYCSKCGTKLNKKDYSKGESKAFGFSRNLRNLGVISLFLGLLLFSFNIFFVGSLYFWSSLFLFILGFSMYLLGWLLGDFLVMIKRETTKGRATKD